MKLNCLFLIFLFSSTQVWRNWQFLPERPQCGIQRGAKGAAVEIFHRSKVKKISGTARVRSRARPVDETASVTKRRGRKMSALQADNIFRAPQEYRLPQRFPFFQFHMFIRGYGGIGRRARFRFLWRQLCTGSSPATRTTGRA